MIKSTTIEIKAGKGALISKTEVVPYRVILTHLDGTVRIQLCSPNSGELLVPADFLNENSFTVNIENTVNYQYVTLSALTAFLGSKAAAHITG